MTHLTTQELEEFVTRAAGADAGRVREHVRGCEECATRLAAEARLEVAMRAAAEVPAGGGTAAVRPGGLVAWLRRPEAIAIAAGFVALSIGTLWLTHPADPGSRAPASRKAFRLGEDAPGLYVRKDLGPGSDLMPYAEAFRDTGAGAAGMLESLGRL